MMDNDLISRSALLDRLAFKRMVSMRRNLYPGLESAISQVKKAKAVDAVEVMRCKDCKHFKIDEGDFLGLCKCGSIATNHGGEIYPEEDFFCAYGERREADG